MGNCSYSLNIDGKIITFANSYELDQFILNNKLTLDYGNISDVVFSTNNKQQETVSLLNSINKKALEIQKVKYDNSVGEYEVSSTTKGYLDYVGVTKKLKELKQPGTDTHLVTPFDISEFKKNRIAQLIAINNYTTAQAVAEVNELEKSWKVGAEVGTEVHAIIEDYFKGIKDYTKLLELHYNTISEENLGSLVNQLNKFENELYKRHGDDAVFIPEFVISNDDMKLLGIIDLVVVDSSGQTHLYDFKSSTKLSDKWYKVKNMSNDYQLGFYRHMLAAQGLPMKKAYMGIIPINISNLDYNTREFESVTIEATQDRTSNKGLSNGQINHLNWGNGKYYHIINHFINVKANTKAVTTDLLDKVNTNLKTVFPVYEFKIKKLISDKKYFKEKLTRPSTKDGMYREFYDTTQNKVIHAKNEEHLDDLIEAYLIRERDNTSSTTEKILSKISDVIDGKEELHSLEFNSVDIDFFPQKIRKYTSDNWEILDMPELVKLGIIPIQNKTHGYVDFITLSVK